MSYSSSENKTKPGSAPKKEDDSLKSSLKPLNVFAVILAIATVIAVFINFLPLIQFRPVTLPDSFSPSELLSQWRSRKTEEPVEETPKVIYFQARPSVEPTPTPAITSFRLFAYGRELGPDGFTTYVEDKPVVISLEMLPFMSHPPVSWSVSDGEAASLSVSKDGKSCEFAALKSAGKIELTVSCNEAEITMPVYLWSRES